MITRYRASMDGVQLDSLDAGIYIMDIREATPQYRSITMQLGGVAGQRVRRIRQSLGVTVDVMVRKYRTEERRTLLDLVRAWMQGRYLTISSRPGMRLRVQDTSLPAASDLKWTETVQLGFTAYAVPFWETAEEASATFNAGKSGSISPGGLDVMVPTDWTVENTGTQVMNSATLQTPYGRMAFSGLGLLVGEQLLVRHDGNGYLQIVKRSESGAESSAFSFRAASSADELMVKSGEANAMSATVVPSAARVTVTARGRVE